MRKTTRQINQYDKVIRENLEAVLPGLSRKLLKIEIAQSEELPDDVQHTKERKPDVLKKITDVNGETFVLHIEWQLEDERKMQYRMLEYYAMLAYRYELPVHQYVIYLGKGKPKKMKDHLRLKGLQFSYELIVFSTVDYHLLLRSDKPEEKMLAILGDFGNRDVKKVGETIVKEVAKASERGLARQRSLKQLEILAQLRDIELENINNMDSVYEYLMKRRETNRWYKLGQEELRVKYVKSLLRKTKISVREIADLADVTEYFVRKTKRALLTGKGLTCKGSETRRKAAKTAA